MSYVNLNPVASRTSSAVPTGGMPVDGGAASATFTHKTVQKNIDVTKVELEGMEEGHSHRGLQPYGGQWWGRYMGWYWLIWIFLVILIIFMLLLIFPPSWVLIQTQNGPVLDLTRLFFISLFLLVLTG
jgi:hypothetical protein